MRAEGAPGGLQQRDVTCFLEKEQEGQLRHHQLRTLSCNPASSSPGLSAGDPEVYMANQVVTSTRERPCWESNMT